ncbi:MAG: PTS sugar transporter subunit IIA, partial [Planctomycetota bacterium]
GRSRAGRQGVVSRMGRRRDLISAGASGLSPAVPAGEAPASASAASPHSADTDRLHLPDKADVLVPLFNTERSPEALIEVGASFADGNPIEVLNITEVPEQTELDDALAERLWVRSLERRVGAMAGEQELDARYNAVVTHDAVSVVQQVAQRVKARWVVLEWRGRTHEGFTIRNPLGWLINHLPCNLAVFKDAGIRYFRKVLVYPEPGPHDALVIRSADHFARAHKADLTLVRYLPASAAAHEIQAQIDYLDQLRRLCRLPVETLMLQGTDEVRTLVAATAGFDMLVTGAPAEMSLWSKMRGTLKDQLMQGATCSVLRLQTPQGEAHRAMSDMRRGRTAASQILEQFDLGAFVDPRFAAAKISITKKDGLFQHIGQMFGPHLEGVTQKDITDGLWSREKLQNTAIGQSMAIPHATLPALDRTWLGIVTTAQPVDYQTTDAQPVDVVFVTLGPPGDRQAHLRLISTLARMVMKSDLLMRLRAATDADSLVAAVRECQLLAEAKPS